MRIINSDFAKIVLVLGMCAGITACEKNLEQEFFNTYFYYSDNREEYLGLVSGLGACQSAAYSKARSLDMENA